MIGEGTPYISKRLKPRIQLELRPTYCPLDHQCLFRVGPGPHVARVTVGPVRGRGAHPAGGGAGFAGAHGVPGFHAEAVGAVGVQLQRGGPEAGVKLLVVVIPAEVRDS